tara:strand:- start:6697 stop:7071 length:375 start_codon:yes stop_codon:yes gene_type:complete
MLKLSETHKQLNVVSDQIGSPTNAGDLAEFLIKIVLSSSTNYGVYHYSNLGAISWYNFTCGIFAQFKRNVEVRPIKTKEYPTAAKRPMYSVLDTKKSENNFGCIIKKWRQGLEGLQNDIKLIMQ